MLNNPSEKILEIVKNNRSIAEEAEREFERANDHIKVMTSKTIDLLGGKVTSSLAEIASASKNACDNLYAELQVLIKDTDLKCRELLPENPSPDSIKQVVDLITWLNEESEIESDFTASFNSKNLGDIASVRYHTPIENKIIQKEWENLYNSIPEVKEQRRKKEEERQKLIDQRNADEAARNNYVEKIRQDFNEKHKQWETEKNNISVLRLKELNELAKQKEISLHNEYTSCYRQVVLEQEKIKKDFTLQKEAAENELSSVGMLNFSRKNELKGIIKNLENEIENADYKIIEAKRTADYNISNIPLYLEKFKLNETARINEKYKIPEEPVAPAEISQTNNKTQQFTNDIDMIFNSMNIGTKYTISDIVDACPGARGLTDERITALVRSLVRIGKVERTDAHGKVYYCRVQ